MFFFYSTFPNYFDIKIMFFFFTSFSLVILFNTSSLTVLWTLNNVKRPQSQTIAWVTANWVRWPADLQPLSSTWVKGLFSKRQSDNFRESTARHNDFNFPSASVGNTHTVVKRLSSRPLLTKTGSFQCIRWFSQKHLKNFSKNVFLLWIQMQVCRSIYRRFSKPPRK